MLEMFTRIEIDEPSEEQALEIIRAAAKALEREYELALDRSVVERAVALSSSFILNKSHPSKSISVLRQVCDNHCYDLATSGQSVPRIDDAAVIEVVSEMTGMPHSTLSGESGASDYERAIRTKVVGQDPAVEAVANELKLIKGGLTDPGKPASVMLFAGMTGVGKTELAKQIAELYSTSKKLQIYSMGNFTEPHRRFPASWACRRDMSVMNTAVG